MNVAEYDPRRWAVTGSWAVEPRDAALARIPEFGMRFFEALFSEFPELAPLTSFLRWSEQPEDVYAVCETAHGGVGVQIDPDLEYIIVWGAGGQAEYGDWGHGQVAPAIDHTRRLIKGECP
jgi:hypothetical protein